MIILGIIVALIIIGAFWQYILAGIVIIGIVLLIGLLISGIIFAIWWIVTTFFG
ncbi:MAG: hypothetical protein FWC91_07530 [Defluviitaleaceae bacterium]|nr:hypothetical protein [Defluviitaleaceae bacterium]